MKPVANYCSGKRAYDKKGAITAANQRFKEDRTQLRIYPCRGHWHLTSQLRNVKKVLYKYQQKQGKKRV